MLPGNAKPTGDVLERRSLPYILSSPDSQVERHVNLTQPARQRPAIVRPPVQNPAMRDHRRRRGSLNSSDKDRRMPPPRATAHQLQGSKVRSHHWNHVHPPMKFDVAPELPGLIWYLPLDSENASQPCGCDRITKGSMFADGQNLIRIGGSASTELLLVAI